MKNIRPFHVAFPVTSLSATRQFFEKVLECKIGRSSERWIDFDLYGHQLSAHLTEQPIQEPAANEVDGKQVPIKHFGVILEWDQWHQLAERLKKLDIDFVISPHIRFEGEVGEQATMFFLDPSGNALEFKAFKDDASIFES
ncbi:VOC family protein [Marivirga sp. S37H4]|uniref:VOC family protein n=1 Tax=Marivirga aurantiaca TaxID=2802615 RepID=A0A935C7I4_9BACT|nr:VOC family protein [Marivirga aurantiaca]MBK6265031.1 VOC family protein [Marivirga aurantiaca]